MMRKTRQLISICKTCFGFTQIHRQLLKLTMNTNRTYVVKSIEDQAKNLFEKRREQEPLHKS